ncbi:MULTISPECIES: copper resistance protein [Cupriavidus]
MARRHSWFVGLLLIVVFVSVQLATAAYACTNGVSQPPADETMAAMVSCADMAEQDMVKGDGQKALCMGHCQADNKHADHSTAQIPAFIPALITYVVAPAVQLSVPLTLAQASAQPRAPPPPLSILHCRFHT